jgi:hypothetical protein
MQIQERSQRADLVALVVSAVAAYVAPLQVFLFAFIVLGPLHYLTEMAWLQKKRFYLTNSVVSTRLYVFVAIAAAVLSLSGAVLKRDLWFWTVGAMLLLSLSVLVRKVYAMAAIAVAAIVIACFLRTWVFFIAVMVPTLVHVFFFTWTFAVSGALRARDGLRAKWMNPVLMLVLPLVLVCLPLHPSQPGGFWLRAESMSFLSIHSKLAGDLHHTVALNATMMDDAVIVGVLRIFAFAYLFHYLNWFSKTEILQWHRTSRRTWIAIAGIYVAYLASFGISFRCGFLISSFLSLLHVLLEFPLNWHTLRFVAGESASAPASRWVRRWLQPEPA